MSHNLYNNLLELTLNNDVFYYKDIVQDDVIYRIFNYRLASYGDFQALDAIWCRGTMFEIDENGKYVRLACRPMQKFFNYGEDPTVKFISPNDIGLIQIKMDGSLISTYLHKDELRLKTKGSLDSVQALDAMKWLSKDENTALKDVCYESAKRGMTLNFEWISPNNQVIVYYEKESLIFLNSINQHGVAAYSFVNELDIYNCHRTIGDNFSPDTIKHLKGIEGYVVVLKNGTWLKIKTDEYLLLHKTKDSVLSDKGLFEVILLEQIDDVIALLHEDRVFMERLDKMRKLIDVYIQAISSAVNAFYETYKDYDRKEYAIMARNTLSSLLFSLAMNKYLKKDINYSQILLKNWSLIQDGHNLC